MTNEECNHRWVTVIEEDFLGEDPRVINTYCIKCKQPTTYYIPKGEELDD